MMQKGFDQKGKEYEGQVNKLRRQAADYYGTAAQVFPPAMADLARVSRMDDEELIAKAKELGLK